MDDDHAHGVSHQQAVTGSLAVSGTLFRRPEPRVIVTNAASGNDLSVGGGWSAQTEVSGRQPFHETRELAV